MPARPGHPPFSLAEKIEPIASIDLIIRKLPSRRDRIGDHTQYGGGFRQTNKVGEVG
jgi:hypothetical protein